MQNVYFKINRAIQCFKCTGRYGWNKVKRFKGCVQRLTTQSPERIEITAIHLLRRTDDILPSVLVLGRGSMPDDDGGGEDELVLFLGPGWWWCPGRGGSPQRLTAAGGASFFLNSTIISAVLRPLSSNLLWLHQFIRSIYRRVDGLILMVTSQNLWPN